MHALLHGQLRLPADVEQPCLLQMQSILLHADRPCLAAK